MSKEGLESFTGGMDAESLSQKQERIEDQNGRFAQVDQVHNVSLRRMVEGDIRDEQIDDFQTILELTRAVQYDSLGQKSVELSTAVQQLEASQVELDHLTANKVNALLSDLAIAQALAPRRSVDISQLADSEVKRIEEVARVKRLDEARVELESVNAAIDQLGSAWPIPAAIPGEDRAVLYDLITETSNDDETDAETSLQVEDVMPVPVELRIHQVETAERAKRIIGNNDASNYITYYLAEKEGKVVTVDELTDFLYVANVGDRRSNVTTLLGPKIQGQRIRKFLADNHDMELQYGWRKTKKYIDGRWVEQPRTRIYRAVSDINSANEDLIADAFLTDTSDTEDVFERIAIEVPTEDIETIEVESTIDAENDIESPVEDNSELWTDSFRTAVAEAIDKLSQDSLFEEDMMSGTRIRGFSSSRILATDTMRNRMLQSGLLRRTDLKTHDMTREQRVIGALLNTQQNTLGNKGKRQKTALAIIREEIDRALKTN